MGFYIRKAFRLVPFVSISPNQVSASLLVSAVPE